MNNDVETEVVAAAEALPEYQTPGKAAVAEAKSLEVQAQTAELDKQADKAWRDSGLDVPYNYRAAYAKGQTNFTDQPLPNEHVASDAINVAGFDLATGEKRRPTVKDRSGHAARGIAELKQSSRTFKGGIAEAPLVDSAALSKLATSFIREGKSFEEFAGGVPSPWNEYHRKIAWDSARSAENTRLLGLALRDNKVEFTQASDTQPYAAMIANPKYAAAGKQIYKSYNGATFEGTDLEAAKWLSGHMRDAYFSDVKMPFVIAHVVRADQKTLDAYTYAHAIEGATEMDPSWQGIGGNVARMVLSPVNLLGMGVGSLAKGTIMMTTARKGLTALLERLGARAVQFGERAAVGAGVGAPMGTAHHLLDSQMSQESPTAMGLAQSAAFSAAAAGVGNAAIPLVLEGAGKVLARAHANIKENGLPQPGLSIKIVGDAARSHDPKTGIGNQIAWEFEKNPDLKMSAEQVRAKAYGQGITQAAKDEISPALEAHLETGKSFTGAEIAEVINEGANPPGVQWVSSGPPPKRFSTTPVEDKLGEIPEYKQAAEAYRGLLAARRDFRERPAEDFASEKDRETQRLQINKAVNDAALAMKNARDTHISPEEIASGYLFAPGHYSDHPMGARLEEVLKGNEFYQGLLAEIAAEKAKTMHWDRQAKLGQLEYSRQRHLRGNFTDKEVAAGRAWAEGQPRVAQGVQPDGMPVEEYMQMNSQVYQDLVERHDEVSANLADDKRWLRASEERGDRAEVARLNEIVLENQLELQRIQTSMDQQIRDALRPEEIEAGQVYSEAQRAGRVQIQAHMNHLASVGTEQKFGLNPESRFEWLVMTDPTSQRTGYSGHVGSVKGAIGWAPTTIRKMDNGGLVKVAEEIQADWQKNLNEARLEWSNLKSANKTLVGADRSYEQLRWETFLEWSKRPDRHVTLIGSKGRDLPDDWTATTPGERRLMVESGFFETVKYLPVEGAHWRAEDTVHNVAPMRYERSFSLNLMKLGLYRAAQQGLDAFAWPTQDAIIGRWPAGGAPVTVKGIKLTSNGEVTPTEAQHYAPGRWRATYQRDRSPELQRATLARRLEDVGEEDAARIIRNWHKDDGPMTINLDKPFEAVPKGFADYKKNTEEMEKYVEKHFSLKVTPIDAERGIKGYPGIMLDEKTREQILKKGINMSKMESGLAVA